MSIEEQLGMLMMLTWVTESVNDTSEKFRADGDIDDLSGSLDGVSLLDRPVGSEDGNTDVVGLQVQALRCLRLVR
jgi:hypothetical protein